MKISFAITVCNEVQELQRLLDSLILKIQPEDEIVVLVDEPKAPEELYKLLDNRSQLRYYRGTFEKDFAAWKNKLNSYCTGDFIFNIDADEMLSDTFLKVLHTVLDRNPEVEMYAVPRDNRVEGLTEEDLERWGWRSDETGRINWPDYQWRIYKNSPKIVWEGKVHEVPKGYLKYAILPNGLHLIHHKTIEKQRKQIDLYSTIQR